MESNVYKKAQTQELYYEELAKSIYNLHQTHQRKKQQQQQQQAGFPVVSGAGESHTQVQQQR